MCCQSLEDDMTDRELEVGLSIFMGKPIHPALDDVPSVQSSPAGLRPVAGARVHMKGLAQALRGPLACKDADSRIVAIGPRKSWRSVSKANQGRCQYSQRLRSGFDVGAE